MNSEEYKELLLQNIDRSILVAGGREIQCRCRYCPDSKDPSSKGHFYISVPQNDEEFSFFDCKKCGAHGMVTPNKLVEWGIYSENLIGKLYEHNKVASRNPRNFSLLEREVYILNNGYIRDDKLSDIKLKYINKRIGTNLSFNDLMKLKIVLNLKDLLMWNNITEYTRYPDIIDQLDESFLGFISLDNAFINMRLLRSEGSVYKSIDKRYVNYNIFNKTTNTERFYTLPTELRLGPDIMRIHIAEGPFDILSIALNLRSDEIGKSIFTSVAGSGYKGLLQHFICQFRLPFLEIHLYPDNDKLGSDEKMEEIVNDIKPFHFPIYIHRNMYGNEKDFGVKPSKIKEHIYSL